jgi:tetratricopeptide (TPR) repeat protein
MSAALKSWLSCVAITVAVVSIHACQRSELARTPTELQPRTQSLQMMEDLIYQKSDPKPSPELLPEDVVKIQLNALKHNDEKNHGIAIAYRFASPENRLHTGPLERFIRMLHNPLYAPMLNYDTEELGAMKKDEQRAEQKVMLIDKNGRAYTYLFLLSKQQEGDYQGCWMTDGVINLTAERQKEMARQQERQQLKMTAAEKQVILDSLFEQLKAAESEDAAAFIENLIWELWLISEQEEVNALMAKGIEEMSRGNYARAVQAFSAITELSPDFPEGWNKRATAYYLKGDFAASMRDIQRTLALEPRHFGALTGLGLIYTALGNELAALKAYESVLSIHPKQKGLQKYVEELRRKLGFRQM